ncbi:hypothetical protein J4210_03990 [Candidatus Woesearchaeota archaeon]|nr:hypothetical protein [Candidatus Woesearchaeota archaeon]
MKKDIRYGIQRAELDGIIEYITKNGFIVAENQDDGSYSIHNQRGDISGRINLSGEETSVGYEIALRERALRLERILDQYILQQRVSQAADFDTTPDQRKGF